MSIPPPETQLVDSRRVSCDGASGIRGGADYRPAALGHPRVFLEIDEHGFVDCGYCDRRFVLQGGPADGLAQASLPDMAPRTS
jgi:NADH dehydrogenase (ubiquinone) Fe-S protein 6